MLKGIPRIMSNAEPGMFYRAVERQHPLGRPYDRVGFGMILFFPILH
jgi:hypothetical protein